MVEIGVAEETEGEAGAVGEIGEEQEEEEGQKENESEESEESEDEKDEEGSNQDFIEELVDEARQAEGHRKRVICILGVVKFLSNLWIFVIWVPKHNFVF